MTRDGDATLLTVSNAVTRVTRAGVTGSGIAGMKERAEAAGGTWNQRVEHGQWIVTARIPNGAEA
jgi:signal transduction histidine kinase